MSGPLTTVVVITHNYGRFLARAVDSAVRQTAEPPVLVVDDASTDDTPAVVDRLRRAHGDRFVYAREPTNRGLAAMRNAAAARVETDWVLFLDADDWLRRDYVAKAERWVAAHPDTDVVTTDLRIVRGWRRHTWRARVPARWTELCVANTIAQSSLIRRRLILDLGGYDRRLDYEDWDFWIRAARRGCRFARLAGAHVYRREHGANKSKTCDDVTATREVLARHPR